MTAPALPPLISSDGHLEVRPERWTPRMPASYRERAPRTVKLPDGGDAILVEGQPPYPAPFLFAERLLADVPADEAFRIASGNVLDFFHLRDTPVGRKALAAMP